MLLASKECIKLGMNDLLIFTLFNSLVGNEIVTGLLLGNNLEVVFTLSNLIVLKLIFNPLGVIQITGLFNFNKILIKLFK